MRCSTSAKAFLPGMREAGWGRIIAMASNTFHSGLAGLTPYVASKGGVIGFVRSLADEVGEDRHHDQRDRAEPDADPGHDRRPAGAVVRARQPRFRRSSARSPADLVGAMAFLASDDAAFITGQTLVVDGGSVRG
jgi:NAD(P)-dependent dehydrogenase (short-subunit alcohol dehydrogenase family)